MGLATASGGWVNRQASAVVPSGENGNADAHVFWSIIANQAGPKHGHRGPYPRDHSTTLAPGALIYPLDRFGSPDPVGKTTDALRQIGSGFNPLFRRRWISAEPARQDTIIHFFTTT